MTPTLFFAVVDVEAVLLPILIQIGIIVVAVRLGAVLFRRLGQPSVVGEVAAGLVLGPSVLGHLCPGLFQAVFHPAVHGMSQEAATAQIGWILTTLSQLGLIFLLFLIGLEFDFSHLRWHGRSALAISLAGIAVPFALGFGLAYFMHERVAADIPRLGFALFLGTALSITAIPVLGRIMMELGITRSRLGSVTIAAAAVDDAVGWMLLATVAAVVRSAFDPANVVRMAAETIGFGLFMAFIARPVLVAWARHSLRRGDGELGVNALVVLVALTIACAIVTNLIGIFAVFGAFILGAVLSGEGQFRDAVNRRLRDFVTAFFLPLYFAYTGLRTDIGSLGTAELWLLCGLTSALAVAGKFGGCGLAAWLCRYSAREAGCIGALMNTRGLMALIVINLGRDLGVVPDTVYCMLILMALVTTAVTTPLVLRLMRGTELEWFVRRSGFLGPPDGMERASLPGEEQPAASTTH